MPLSGAHLSRSHMKNLTSVPITDSIPDMELRPALATPPFIKGAPLLNLRDLGLVPESGVRPEYAYRSGGLHENDTEWLSKNVKKIFDLRHDNEIAQSPDPAVPGIDNVRLPLAAPADRLVMAEFVNDDGATGWARQYIGVTSWYANTIRAVLMHVRDSPEPFLFHCSGGRDRTGVVAGLLHHIAGTPQTDIVYDYLLTRVGLEPERERLIIALKGHFSPEDAESPVFFNVAALRPEIWTAFETELQKQYGGWDGYIGQLGFSQGDLQAMRANLTGTAKV